MILEDNSKGVVLAIISYCLWGVLTIFWTLFKDIPILEILCHRILWSMLIIIIVTFLLKRPLIKSKQLHNKREIILVILSAGLIGTSWFFYVWAINSHYIIEASLGYFITPLIIVILGIIFNREQLTRWQWISVLFMIVGLLYMLIEHGNFPWIALVLSLSFSLYTYIKKISNLNILEGFFIEVSILSIPSIIYLSIITFDSNGNFGTSSVYNSIMLVFSGLVTAVPLIIYSLAIRRINLSVLGILQYILPTIQFIIGLYLFDEELSSIRLVGFIFVWLAIIIYLLEGNVKNKINSLYKYS